MLGTLLAMCGITVVALQREKPMAVGNPLRQFREASQKEKPMAVGGIGMITTANYVARRHACCRHTALFLAVSPSSGHSHGFGD